MKSASILIVEDHLALQLELSEFLQSKGYFVRTASSITEAEIELESPVDMLLLDINLPDGSGIDFCRNIRPYVRSGIIMFTGRSEAHIKVESLKDGADAYLVKPVNIDELEATLISVHRRINYSDQVPSLVNIPLPPVFRLDRTTQALYLPNQIRVALTGGEFFFLITLFAEPEYTITREELCRRYEEAKQSYSDTRVENIVSRLKRKILSLANQHFPISAIYGKGYVFKGCARIIS